jgi:predicted acyltransferase (DUF342 family)
MEEVRESKEIETEKAEDIFALKKLIIPSNTKFEERNIVVEKDIIIGAGSKLAYGLMGRRVIVGEKATIDGDVVGEEVRLDSWNAIKGNVICKGDAYIGEFTTIEGRLTVFGDLEIGRNVKIKNGFEAKGLITIQDPLPILIFLFLYLLELLRLGRLEEAEKLFEVVEEIENPLVIPENSTLTLEFIRSNTDFEAEDSRILGNIRVKNAKAASCEIFGSIRAGKVIVDGCRVHGSIEGKTIYLLNGSEVYGAVKGERIYMEDSCTVESSIIGKDGVWIKRRIELPDRLITQLVEDTEEDRSKRLTKVEITERKVGKKKSVKRVRKRKRKRKYKRKRIRRGGKKTKK